MKLICPSCDTRIDISDDSRFHIFQCSCGKKFRGTNAEHDNVDFLLKKFFWFTLRGYDAVNETPCIHCGARIRFRGKPIGEGPGIITPRSCWSCGGQLPRKDPV